MSTTREKMLDEWVDILVAYARLTIPEKDIEALQSACDGDISYRAAVVWLANNLVKEQPK